MTETPTQETPANERAAKAAPNPFPVSKGAIVYSGEWKRQHENAQLFVRRLLGLREARAGSLALLRRNAGESLSTSRNVLSAFYKLQPPPKYLEQYFLVATLFDLNRARLIPGDMGDTMRLTRLQSSDSFERRFLVLLGSAFDAEAEVNELAYRLRQLVKIAGSKEVGLNWPVLLADLCLWDDARKPVQKKWAANFYQLNAPLAGEATSEAAGPNTPASDSTPGDSTGDATDAD